MLLRCSCQRSQSLSDGRLEMDRPDTPGSCIERRSMHAGVLTVGPQPVREQDVGDPRAKTVGPALDEPGEKLQARVTILEEVWGLGRLDERVIAIQKKDLFPRGGCQLGPHH